VVGTEQRILLEQDSVLFHSGMDHGQSGVDEQHKQAGLITAFSDWFIMTQADDAVLSDASSFGYTAFATTLRLPVTVWNDDAPNATQPVPINATTSWRTTAQGRCDRRVWGSEHRPFEMIMSAERFFAPGPQPSSTDPVWVKAGEIQMDAVPLYPRTLSSSQRLHSRAHCTGGLGQSSCTTSTHGAV